MTLPRMLKMTWLAASVLLSSPLVLAHQRHDLGSLNTLFEVRRAIESFHRTYGVYPPQANWMNELMAMGNPVMNINRREKIFYEAKEPSQPIQDRWHNDLVYLLPGMQNPASFDLYSLGEDGETRSNGDDPDDLAIWHSPERFQSYYGLPTWLRRLRYGLSRGAVVIAVILIFLAAIWTLLFDWLKSSASHTST